MARMSTVCIGFAAVLAVWVLHASAVPLGDRSEVEAATTATTTEVALANVTVVDTLNTELSVAGGNETELTRVKRSGCCGCCCCRPCCCCCRPCCCCCCKPCCCCCRCCCCRCCCCCCKPCCCCCCRPCCCCGGCGCCGCGGRKRRSIAALTHKLMDQQAAIVRASAEVVESEFEATTTTTEAAAVALLASTTSAPVEAITIAQMDSYGRRQF
uniref:Agouti domain-containing protein n=1 Tax=Panagrellus redivivus TaxID=6233 RepID=A0A7E4VZZ4_PANRE